MNWRTLLFARWNALSLNDSKRSIAMRRLRRVLGTPPFVQDAHLIDMVKGALLESTTLVSVALFGLFLLVRTTVVAIAWCFGLSLSEPVGLAWVLVAFVYQTVSDFYLSHGLLFHVLVHAPPLCLLSILVGFLDLRNEMKAIAGGGWSSASWDDEKRYEERRVSKYWWEQTEPKPHQEGRTPFLRFLRSKAHIPHFVYDEEVAIRFVERLRSWENLREDLVVSAFILQGVPWFCAGAIKLGLSPFCANLESSWIWNHYLPVGLIFDGLAILVLGLLLHFRWSCDELRLLGNLAHDEGESEWASSRCKTYKTPMEWNADSGRYEPVDEGRCLSSFERIMRRRVDGEASAGESMLRTLEGTSPQSGSDRAPFLTLCRELVDALREAVARWRRQPQRPANGTSVQQDGSGSADTDESSAGEGDGADGLGGFSPGWSRALDVCWHQAPERKWYLLKPFGPSDQSRSDQKGSEVS
ncbi:MAG: hypothetical protein AAF682_28400 [Planctomycetota bacterium]